MLEENKFSFRALLHGKDAEWYFARGLDDITAAGSYEVRLFHNDMESFGITTGDCDKEHYVVAHLFVSESAATGKQQALRAVGQTLLLTICATNAVKAFTRTCEITLKGASWGSWVDLGAASTTDIQDGSIAAQKLISDVRGKLDRVTEVDEIKKNALHTESVHIVSGIDEVSIGGRSINGEAVVDIPIPVATIRNAGVMSAEDKTVLNELPVRIKPLRYVVGDNSIADCFVYVEVKGPFQEITIQRFMGINDTQIVLYVWEDGSMKSKMSLAYSAAEIDGTQYIWQTEDYVIIVDFALHKEADGVATSANTGISLSHKCFSTLTDGRIDTLQDNVTELKRVPKMQGYYINTKGDIVKTSVAAFWLSSYAYAEAGVIIRNAKPVPSASNSYIHFYDCNFNHMLYISVASSSVIPEKIITEEDIPVGARYMRVEVTDTGDVYAKTLINLDDIAPKALGVPFDYATALSMDKNVLRNAVEAASAGKCTVLYDNDGYPSLMYRIPVMSVGAFSQDLGDFATPHPAFVVGGVRKNEIYISVFQTCVYNGHYVSWFGLPSTSMVGIADLRNNIRAKGEGWHLETVYERSLLGLLALKYNSPTPRGNTCWGRSSAVGFEYECAKMYNGKLPGNAESGEGEQINGALWINGTQSHAWSPDKSAWGIQDVIGGYHEICDLIKMVDGFLYMAEDNNYSADESTWINTGVVIDARNGNNVFSTTVTSSMTESDNYIKQDVNEVLYDESFDTLPDAIRKRMAMLFITTRLTHDGENLLGISGSIGSRPAGVGYLVSGGATEYADSGLGYYNIAYDLKNVPTHNNMGSRMVYIG